MKGNRQIGLDGRVFISDCLNDGIFFVYSIILSGILSAAGDVMKLLGQSSRGMDELTNGLVILDLVCSLGMVVVAYYVYFMHCGENVPRLGTKPLIYLEYIRLAYYGILVYFVLYRLLGALQNRDSITIAVPIFYFAYLAWLVTCVFAAMFILTVLDQNMIRRSYAKSFKLLSLTGLAFNIILPLVYFITRFWVRGWGDGFYSAGLCDFVRLCLAPMFYSAVWFLFMNAIDQVERVFGEVDNAIRDKRYRIEFEDTEEKVNAKKEPKKKVKAQKPMKARIEKKKKIKPNKKPKNSYVQIEEETVKADGETSVQDSDESSESAFEVIPAADSEKSDNSAEDDTVNVFSEENTEQSAEQSDETKQ